MLNIKRDINQQDFTIADLFFGKSEVVDRVSETQIQVGENSNYLIWRLKY